MTQRITGTLTSATTTSSIFRDHYHSRDFGLSLSGTWVATVALQCSYDGGSTWITMSTFTGPAVINFTQPAHNVYMRLECTYYSSGTITYFLGQ